MLCLPQNTDGIVIRDHNENMQAMRDNHTVTIRYDRNDL